MRGQGEAGGPIPAELADRIRLVIFDVDGVLTDGGVYLGRDAGTRTVPGGGPIELKRFDIQDGLGMKFLEMAGIKVVMVSGRISPATDLRARELGVECHQDAGAHKLPIVQGILDREGIAWEEVAMLADDLPDMAVFRKVGLRAAVANAVTHIAETAHWRSTRPGGRGAAREFCDGLLQARGDLDWVVEKYVGERSRP